MILEPRFDLKIGSDRYIPCTPETWTAHSNTFFFWWTTQESTLLIQRIVTGRLPQRRKGEWTLTTFIDKTPNHFYSCLVFLFFLRPPPPVWGHSACAYRITEPKAPSKIEIPENLTRKIERQLFISQIRDMYVEPFSKTFRLPFPIHVKCENSRACV